MTRKQIINKGAQGLLCLVTLISLTGYGKDCFTGLPSASVLPHNLLSVLAIPGLWMLYGKLLALREERQLQQMPAAWPLLVLAVMESLVIVLGLNFIDTDLPTWLWNDRTRFLLLWIGRVPFYYAVFRLLQMYFQNDSVPGILLKWENRRSLPLILGGLLILCWLPWIIHLFPGLISSDSFDQIQEFTGMTPMTAANPIFQTVYLGLFYQLGVAIHHVNWGIALYCTVQTLWMAWLMGLFLAEFCRRHVPTALFVGSFCFFAFHPVFPIFAFQITKDTYFSIGIGFFSLAVYHMLQLADGPRTDPKRFWGVSAWLIVSAVFCMLLRNAGIFLAVSVLLALGIYLLIRKKPGFAAVSAAAMGMVLGVYALLNMVILPGLGIVAAPESEFLSVPFQQVGRIAAWCDLPEDQREILDRVFDFEDGEVPYDPELSDDMKLAWREDAAPEDKDAFWKLYPQLVRQYPMQAVEAVFHNGFGFVYPGFLSDFKTSLFLSYTYEEFAVEHGYPANPLTDHLVDFVGYLMDNPIFHLLISPGLFGLITLFAVVCLLCNRQYRYLLCMFPALALLIGCFFTPLNAYLRYALPLYFMAPFLLMLLTIRKKKE